MITISFRANEWTEHCTNTCWKNLKDAPHCFYRRATLASKARALWRMTGAHVLLTVIPTWVRGQMTEFRSPDFPDGLLPKPRTPANAQLEEGGPMQVVPELDEDIQAPEAAGLHGDRHAQGESVLDEKHKCQVCHIYYNSDADKARRHSPLWVCCCSSRCGYWVHASCCGIQYTNERALRQWSKGHFYCYKQGQ